MSKKELKFEASFKRLEEIVDELERGDLTLEKSLEVFEEGIKLSRFCSTKLDEAEKRIEILMQDKQGELKAVPWEEKERSLAPKKEIPVATETFDVVEEAKEDTAAVASDKPESEVIKNNDEGKLF